MIFDNDYRCYIENEYIGDKNGALIADLHLSLCDLPLKLSEMSDTQIWALCRPIIMAYEKGIERTQNEMTKKLLSLFDLKVEDE